MTRFDTRARRGRWLLIATAACFSVGVVLGYFMSDAPDNATAALISLITHGGLDAPG